MNITKIILTLLFLLSTVALAGDKESYNLNSLEDARKLIMERGVDEKELGIPIKVLRIGGLGEGGHWTFYTLKACASVKSIVIIMYKPEFGSVLVIREDLSPFSDIVHSYHILQDNSTGVWSFYGIDKEMADGMVKSIFRAISTSLITNPYWDFEVTDKMRSDLCWPIKGRENK